MTFVFVLLSIAILVLLIVWAKLNPFLAFLIASIFAGLMLGLPADQVAKSVQKGMGAMLGDLVIVIAYGIYCQSPGRPLMVLLCLVMMPLVSHLRGEVEP